MSKKSASWTKPEIGALVSNSDATNQAVRTDSVRGFCPCHAGWEVFEEHVGDVLRALRTGNREERAHALHVFDDAARMQLAEERRYYVEPGEERIGEKRACARFRSIEERLEARRDRRSRKRQRRHRDQDHRRLAVW
jgi:hypothetical protein